MDVAAAVGADEEAAAVVQPGEGALNDQGGGRDRAVASLLLSLFSRACLELSAEATEKRHTGFPIRHPWQRAAQTTPVSEMKKKAGQFCGLAQRFSAGYACLRRRVKRDECDARAFGLV